MKGGDFEKSLEKIVKNNSIFIINQYLWVLSQNFKALNFIAIVFICNKKKTRHIQNNQKILRGENKNENSNKKEN